MTNSNEINIKETENEKKLYERFKFFAPIIRDRAINIFRKDGWEGLDSYLATLLLNAYLHELDKLLDETKLEPNSSVSNCEVCSKPLKITWPVKTICYSCKFK